jgi:integrase
MALVQILSNRKWKMASIRQRGGKWQARVIRHGHAPQAKTFTKRLDAERWARAVEADIERGVPIQPSTQPAMTLSELLARYLEEVVPGFKGATEDTIRIKAIQRARLCGVSVSFLAPSHIAAFRDERLAQVSAGTVIRELAYISSAINHARREWGLQVANPVALVRKPTAPRGRERVLTEEEEQRLLDALRPEGRRSAWMLSLVKLALATGMRRGELLSLRWEEVDIDRRIAFLRDTKNGDSRRVPLSSAAVAVFQALGLRSEGSVFPITPYAVAAAFKRATQRAAIPNVRFHDLRHTAITAMSRKLPNVIELASVTGHKSLKMLQRYYHPSAEELAQKLG